MPPKSAAATPAAPAVIAVSRVVLCGHADGDRGSGRIRLPASAWAAARIPYHKPVIVTIPAAPGDSSGSGDAGGGGSGDGAAWRLLCTSALLDADEGDLGPPRTPDASSSPATRPLTAVLDVSVVASAPPGASLAQLRQRLAEGPPCRVAACRGPGAPLAAAAVQLELPPRQPHLASRLRFKLHQALVLPGCILLLADDCAVGVAAVQPPPAGPDAPVRIVPSTRIGVAGGAPPPAGAQPPDEAGACPQQTRGEEGRGEAGGQGVAGRQERVGGPPEEAQQPAGSPAGPAQAGLHTSQAPGSRPPASHRRGGISTPAAAAGSAAGAAVQAGRTATGSGEAGSAAPGGSSRRAGTAQDAAANGAASGAVGGRATATEVDRGAQRAGERGRGGRTKAAAGSGSAAARAAGFAALQALQDDD